MDKKEIDSKVAIKSLINSFVCYGILCIFICLFILSIATYFLKGFSGTAAKGLYVTLPLIAVIIIYFVIHCICKISTYDIFKKCKTNPSNYKDIVKHLNIFFIICIIISIVLFLSLLYLEIGIATSFLSLIPYQRKMILKYNEF